MSRRNKTKDKPALPVEPAASVEPAVEPDDEGDEDEGDGGEVEIAPTETPPDAEILSVPPVAPALPDEPAASVEPAVEPAVERFKVTENCRYVLDGQVHVWPIGHVIDGLNYNLADVRAQGVPLAPATIEDVDTTPAIGHRAC